MTRQSGACWNCGLKLEALDYGRGDVCSGCGRDTRVCKGCIHFDASSHNQCREPQAERVVEKERSNFCDYFEPAASVGASGNPSQTALKNAAEALFKKK